MTDLTFAIGDIHGCLVKLTDLVFRCRQYAGDKSYRFVFLGDYIDRGPDSRGVIRLLRAIEAEGHICLKGNHEVMMISVLHVPANHDWWCRNGGVNTLASYGVQQVQDIPADDVEWMRNLPVFYDDGERFFVHAGIDPDKPLDQQTEEVMLWTRNHAPPLQNIGRLIVHGHTPLGSQRPLLLPNRLNMDTGAVFGGVLTAAVFDDKYVEPVAYLSGTKIIIP